MWEIHSIVSFLHSAVAGVLVNNVLVPFFFEGWIMMCNLIDVKMKYVLDLVLLIYNHVQGSKDNIAA